MNELQISFNENTYNVNYNTQSGYYEIELTAPQVGGIYNADVSFTDLFEDEYTGTRAIQILAEESLVIKNEKSFISIFDGKDFHLKDIIELADFEITIDEETNANSTLKVVKENTAKANDIIVVIRNNELIYWGIIDNIQNEDGKKNYEMTTKYLTNLFSQNIQLKYENIIREIGIEDFIALAITENFISSDDSLINKTYIELNVLTHTTKAVSVSNVQDGIYNLHTWMTNCTQKYGIVYSFSIVNKKLLITIENKSIKKELIDTKAQAISNYNEVFDTDVVAKVTVLYSKKNGVEQSGTYTLYLKNDRTTTTNKNDVNRADGKVETVYIENYEDANQKALDTMKANRYNHNISFNLYNRIIPVGTPIAIKTKKSAVFDTYISAIKITKNKFVEHTCGNIRVNFIDKLLKERNSNNG